MGYFPNGTAGMLYEEQHCSRCVHQENCAVWTAHLLHSYEECNKPESILHLLIPMDDHHDNEQCAMFFDKKKVDPNHDHPDLFQ